MTHSPPKPKWSTNVPGRLREFWFYFRENRGAVIGLCIFAVFAFLALFGPWVAPHDATAAVPRQRPCSPRSGRRAAAGRYILGTDPLGRDMLSRLIMGARYSFFVGVVVVSVAASGGHPDRADRRLCAEVARHHHHADHGHHPGLPVAAAGAGAGGHPRAVADQRDDRHRHRAAAALRAPDPCQRDVGTAEGLCHLRPRRRCRAVCG